jgi:hypothetical protein
MDGWQPNIIIVFFLGRKSQKENNTKNPQSTKENTLSELLQGVSFKLRHLMRERKGG